MTGRDISHGAGAPRTEALCHADHLQAVSLWTTGTSGSGAIEVMLHDFAAKLQAVFASIARIDRHRPTSSQMVITGSPRPRREAPDRGTQAMSYAAAVCGQYLPSARPGTIWSALTDDLPIDPAAHLGRAAARLAEVLVIPLAPQTSSLDFLEIGLTRPQSDIERDRMTLLGPVLASAWQNRSVGCFLSGSFYPTASSLSHSRGVGARTRPAAAPQIRVRPLSMDNPYRLSRAEFRICLLMSRGLKRTDLTQTLGISTSTLRTHLRNIYAKTETHSEADLLRFLVVSQQIPGPALGSRVA